jgi:hypothetical protein
MSNLEHMSMQELIDLAQERRIEVTSTMTKDELVKALDEGGARRTVPLRSEDEEWVELHDELAGLRREVEEARLERERAEDELRREQEKSWLEKEQQLAHLQAREAVIRRRARARARELRDNERTTREPAPGDDDVYYSDRIGAIDDSIGSNVMYCGTNEMSRLVRSLATAFADAAGSMADVMFMGMGSAQERMDPVRPGSGRRSTSTVGSRSGRSGQGMMMGLPNSAYNTLRDVMDRSMNVPARAVDRFYDEYYKK